MTITRMAAGEYGDVRARAAHSRAPARARGSADHPDVLRFTLVPVPVPEGFAAEWLGRYEEGRRSGVREGFAVVDDGEFLGLAFALDITDGTAELGYVSASNAASLRVAEKAGYTREGVLRSVHFKQGRRDDMVIWSRLPTDA
jgi:RimJ/RimL family protein N-acetyltransferase